MTTYGRDTWCVESLSTGRMASGLQLLGQRVFRRYITPRGTLRGGRDEANYGLDLSELCGAADTEERRVTIGPRVINEARKDPQVEDCKCLVEFATAGGLTTYTLTIDVFSALGPFQLVVGVSSVTVNLIGFSE